MPLLAEFSLTDAMILTLEVFLFVIWIMILLRIIVDLFRDRELGGFAKATWLFALIVLPYISAFIYLISRGAGMQKRAIEEQVQMQQAAEQYIRDVAATPADELQKLADLHGKGVLSDDEFAKAKARLVS